MPLPSPCKNKTITNKQTQKQTNKQTNHHHHHLLLLLDQLDSPIQLIVTFLFLSPFLLLLTFSGHKLAPSMRTFKLYLYLESDPIESRPFPSVKTGHILIYTQRHASTNTQSHKDTCVFVCGGGGCGWRGGGGKSQEVGERALYINTPTATTKINCILTGKTVGHFIVINVRQPNKAMFIHQNL